MITPRLLAHVWLEPRIESVSQQCFVEDGTNGDHMSVSVHYIDLELMAGLRT